MTTQPTALGQPPATLSAKIRVWALRFATQARAKFTTAQQPKLASTALAYGLFWSAWFGGVAYTGLTQLAFTVRGEMVGEIATNYFYYARNGTIWQQLFANDGGYQSTIPRLVAWLGQLLHIPTVAIPYYYSWGAAILGVAAVAVFLLPVFRPLIPSDLTRMVIAVAAILCADFLQRALFGFAYFFIFTLLAVTALALVTEVPKWAWLAPLLMLSKPTALALIPVMVLACVVATRRFRWVTLATLVAGALQLLQIGISSSQLAEHYAGTSESLLHKLVSAGQYLLGLLGRALLGTLNNGHTIAAISIGAVALVIAVGVFVFTRGAHNALIASGVLMVIFSAPLFTIALTTQFGPDLSRIEYLALDRYGFGILCAVLFIIAGVAAGGVTLIDRWLPVNRFVIPIVTSIALVCWLLGSNVLPTAVANAAPIGPPFTGTSQWISMATEIDTNQTALCVPIDHVSYTYSAGNCQLLDQYPYDPADTTFAVAHSSDDSSSDFAVPLFDDSSATVLYSFGLLAQPLNGVDGQVSAAATLQMADGSTVVWTTSTDLLASGGGLFFYGGRTGINLHDIRQVQVTTSRAVKLAYLAVAGVSQPRMLVNWYGW